MNNYTPEQIAKQAAKNESDFVSQTNQALQNLKFALDEIKNSLEKHIGEHSSFKQSFHTSLDEITTAYDAWHRQQDSICTQRSMISKGNFDHLDSRIKALESDHIPREAHQDLVNRVKEELCIYAQKHNSLIQMIASIDQKLASDFKNQILSLKSEILSKPSDAPSIKKDLEDKISIVGMDSTNANIRTANCEKAIMLIEKKIENIFLLLKKLELDK